jgi:hypothetical protein
MVARIASEALIERLAGWGVDTATTLFQDKIGQLRS